MSVSKVRLFALGLAAAGVVAAALLINAGNDLRSGLRLDAAEPVSTAREPADGAPTGEAPSGVRVDAPGTVVDVDKERGKVRVTAPDTDIRVDPDERRVQVRAPHVNLDIRW